MSQESRQHNNFIINGTCQNLSQEYIYQNITTFSWGIHYFLYATLIICLQPKHKTLFDKRQTNISSNQNIKNCFWHLTILTTNYTRSVDQKKSNLASFYFVGFHILPFPSTSWNFTALDILPFPLVPTAIPPPFLSPATLATLLLGYKVKTTIKLMYDTIKTKII